MKLYQYYIKKPFQNLSKNLSKTSPKTYPKPIQKPIQNHWFLGPPKIEFCAYIYIYIYIYIAFWSNLVWHWNGKRRLILEFRFRWRMHTNLINQTKHRQPYLFKFTWEKKKQTKHSNTTQTNIAVYSCPPALNTFVTLHALSGSSVHANVCPWVPHSARFARLARRSAFEGWAILFKLLIRF